MSDQIGGQREWAEDETALCQEISQKSGIPLPTGPVGQQLPCLMTFIRSRVNDAYRPSTSRDNEKASTLSIFDDQLTTYNNTRLYTLNRLNFDAAYEFLLPRAVAYSGG